MRGLLLFTFILLSLTSTAQKKLQYKGKQYCFKLFMEQSGNNKYPDCHVKEIEVVVKDSNEHIQTIIPPENSPLCNIGKKELFDVADVNFDGYEDIRMKISKDSYVFWVFNPDVEEFIRDKSLELLTDPYLDFDKKEVVSSWRHGCCRKGSSRYKFIDNKLTLVGESEYVTQDNESTKYVIRKLVDGNMKIVDEGYQ